jgi:pimeloyl-ACP methyl ester carboxylesterase
MTFCRLHGAERTRAVHKNDYGHLTASLLPEGEYGYSLVVRMAEDAAALLDALQIPAAHVAGFSGGSLIAQELALRYPKLVCSLVLISTWARPDALNGAAAVLALRRPYPLDCPLTAVLWVQLVPRRRNRGTQMPGSVTPIPGTSRDQAATSLRMPQSAPY